MASRYSAVLVLVGLALVLVLGALMLPRTQGADVVLLNGRVWTGPGAPASGSLMPTAVAVADGRIVAVGWDEEIATRAGWGTRRIDLGGRMVIPGLMDAHTHFVAGGFELAGVQLRDAASEQEFARRIGDFAAVHPDEWVTGGTWDHELWGGELPRRDWIDSLTGETPVFVSRLDGHMALANSRALELAGVTADTEDPEGGTIVRAPDGQPTGVLKDAAMSLVYAVIPDPSQAELDRALQASIAHAVERGVTMITDMGGWSGHETYRRAHDRGDLPIRVYSVVQIDGRERLAEHVAEEGRGDDRFFWGGVKAFVDGSLGSTTAWFYAPYEDAPETTGLMVSDTAQLRDAILAADAAELQLIVHAIGDRANDWLLDVFAEARERNGERDRRPRIEHAQHLTAAAIGRFGDEGVIPSMQPYHAIDDGRWAEKRIGPDRIKTTYAFRGLEDAGARLAFGSDWPVAPLDPLYGIYAAVTRRTTDGANPAGWVPEQKVTVEEALAAYTVNNAYACFMEDRLGTLEPGKYADLVVLEQNIFQIDPTAIEKLRVDLTMVDGEVVFER
jgi:predicted amidohydrolase YtcJ